MQEEWRTVVVDGEIYENYMVSSWGNVKSLNYNHTGREKIMKLTKNTNNYFTVILCKGGNRKRYLVHRLVAMAFVKNDNSFSEVNHIDENKENNSIENLEWCDHKYNMNYGTRNQRAGEKHKGKHHTEESKKKMSEVRKGEKHHYYGKQFSKEHKRKLSEAHKGRCHSDETKRKIGESNSKKVLCIETNEIFTSTMETSRLLGITQTSISACCRRKYKQTHGLTFRYLDEVLFYSLNQ